MYRQRACRHIYFVLLVSRGVCVCLPAYTTASQPQRSYAQFLPAYTTASQPQRSYAQFPLRQQTPGWGGPLADGTVGTHRNVPSKSSRAVGPGNVPSKSSWSAYAHTLDGTGAKGICLQPYPPRQRSGRLARTRVAAVQRNQCRIY